MKRKSRVRRLLLIALAVAAAGYLAGARVSDNDKKHIVDRLSETSRMPGRLLT